MVERALGDILSRAPPTDDEQTAQMISDDLIERAAIAKRLPAMSTPQKRELLITGNACVQLTETAIQLELTSAHGSTQICQLPARLVSRGSGLKLALPPADAGSSNNPDPVLLKLVAQAKAAQDMVITGSEQPTVASYGKRHLWQLLRISWLAPDILSAIVDGRQPPELTGRRLLRATKIPLDWAGQRALLGFA